MTTKRLFIPLFALAFASLLLWPAGAEAQRRGPGPGRVVVLGGGWGYPGFGLQNPWGRYGPWGQYSRPYYPYGFYDYEYFASVRIESDVKTAEVYVDGSQAGVVDDFDGWYQSLNLRAGDHEITLYADGYRTQTHRVYFSANSSQHFRWNLEKLAAGQSAGARPQPAPPAEQPAAPGNPRAPQAPRPINPPEPAPAAPQNARFGTLSLKVMPGDAEILVDGQKWAATPETGRVAIKLSAGRHHIEVKKDGFQAYIEDVLIRPEAAMSLNVGLTKR